MLVRLVLLVLLAPGLVQGVGRHPVSGREYARPMGVEELLDAEGTLVV